MKYHGSQGRKCKERKNEINEIHNMKIDFHKIKKKCIQQDENELLETQNFI